MSSLVTTHKRGPSTSFSHDPEPVLVKVHHLDPEAARRRLHHDLDSIPHKKIIKICCIGAGYVGGPTCSVIAKNNPDIEVTIVDLSQSRIDAWKSNDLPIHEPNLLDVVQSARDSTPTRPANLFFSTDVKGCIAKADLIFVSVNTPTKQTGAGKGRASELSYVESAIRTVAEVSTSDKIIVEKSTVPVRTAEAMREVLLANCHPGVKFEILSNPEFLAEGTAIKNLVYPDRILIGSLNSEAGLSAAASLVDVYTAWVPREKIITTNLWSSELAKLAANCLLAQRISSINALSAICENTGADVAEVAFACGLDTRIGPKMLGASVGFGGSCLKKDILSLAYIAESVGLKEVSDYWRAINDMNEYQKTRFAKRIVDRLYGSLINKKIAILGFAFKKDTGDCRESAAISIVADLVAEGATITIYDPKAPAENIWWELEHVGLDRKVYESKIILVDNAEAACIGASAAVIVTEWDEFSNKQLYPTLEVQINGISTNGISNGVSNGVSNGISNGVSNGISNKVYNGISNGVSNGISNGVSKGVSKKNATADGRLDWAHLATVMARPMYVFDGRNIVDVGKLQNLGFRVECIGKVGTGKKIVVDYD